MMDLSKSGALVLENAKPDAPPSDQVSPGVKALFIHTVRMLVRQRDVLVWVIAFPLVLATLFFVADGIQVVAAQANRAAGDVWWPTIMHFAAYGAVMMPLGWVLAHQMGVNGLVWAVVIASLASSTLLTGRFIRIARRLPHAGR